MMNLKDIAMNIFKNLLSGSVKLGKPVETSDETFETDVLKSELPVVVDFWSPVCMPCQVMSGLLREVGPEYAGRVNICKLDVPQNTETAMRFHIRSVPTLLFVKNGRMADQTAGLIPIDTLRNKLDKLAASVSS
jgi:thioredoxin